MVRKPCSECGCTDIPKYEYWGYPPKQGRTKYLAKYCVRCRREDDKLRIDKYRDKRNARARELYDPIRAKEYKRRFFEKHSRKLPETDEE